MELLEQVLSKVNMNDAYLQVYNNKGTAGIDGMTVFELKSYLRLNGEKIKEKIRNRKYKPMPVKRVEIPKPDGGVRLLGIPTVIDRTIQQAIAQILTPIYEKEFSEYSYGFRPNRSAHMALIKSLEIINDGYDWIVDIDLERFFDTVNHDRLMGILNRTIKDSDLMSLIRKYLESGVINNNTFEETEIGTPQGGNLSPLLSNIMLNELDKELEKRGLNFVRYADDCNIYVRTEKAANRVMTSITKFIETKLGLIVNTKKSKIVRPNELKFLEYGYYKDYKTSEYNFKLHKISEIRIKRKLKKLTKRNWSISLDNRLLKLKQLIVGWVNYFKLADMKTLMQNLDSTIRRAIRVIIWKQWKNNTKRIDSLVKLGIDKEEAKGLTYCRKGYQFIAKSYVVHRAIRNRRLNKRGLTSMLDQYLKVKLV